ncbi:MAG: hypothetical protein K1Y36_15010 [Blastocatellia bacterium]|nr:hypothetical protein [Blastocatellia bacterium]
MFRSLLLGLISACIWFHVNWTNSHFKLKTNPFGNGGDTILTYPTQLDTRNAVLQELQVDLAARLKPTETLVVLPEGILLNYLFRKTNPTPYIVFTPYDLVSYGGETVTLQGLQTHAPDVIVLLQRTFGDWEFPPFGTDARYGQAISNWMRQQYVCVRVIGAEPGTGSKAYGVAVWQRKPVGGAVP